MKEPFPFLDPLIIESLIADYGIQVVALTFLPIGADINAALYRARDVDQTSYFVKLKRECHRDMGVKVVDLLHNAGIKEVIPAVRTADGRLSSNVKDFSLIVYPFVEGQNGFSRELTDSQWLQLGRALRQVHEVRVPSSITREIRRETFSPKWREIVRSLYAYIDAEPIDEIASMLLRFMKANMGEVRKLVDRAETLSQKVQNNPAKFVLCHSDIHAGNILLRGKDAIYIVDWDDPVMAPKERDLMFIGGGVGNVWNKMREGSLFYEGYGEAEVDPLILAYYRHERIVEDIAVYGQELLLTNKGGDGRLEMYRHFVELFKNGGVVDIALKADF